MEILQQIDWNIVFPVFTLFLGFLLGYGKDYFDRRRNVNNLYFILEGKLTFNHFLLLDIVKENSEDILLITFSIDNLSLLVFESYFNRLDTLKRPDLSIIHSAFYLIRYLKRNNDQIKHKMETNPDELNLQEAVSFLNKASEKALQTTEDALLTFKYGEETVERISRDHESGLA